MYFLMSKFRNLVWKICKYNNKALFWVSVMLDVILINLIVGAFLYNVMVGLVAFNLVVLSMAYLFFRDFDQNKIAFAVYSLRKNNSSYFSNENYEDEEDEEDEEIDEEEFIDWLEGNDRNQNN